MWQKIYSKAEAALPGKLEDKSLNGIMDCNEEGQGRALLLEEDNEKAQGRILQLQKQVVWLRSLSRKTDRETEELRKSLHQSNKRCQKLEAKVGKLGSRLKESVQFNEQCQKLEAKVEKLRSRLNEFVQYCSCRSGAVWQAALKRHSENSEDEPPRKRRTIPIMDHWGRSLLHLAAEEGDTKKVKKLLKAGFGSRARDFLRKTPLHSALFHSQEAVAEILADEKNDDRDITQCTPLLLAARKGYLGVVRKLLAAGCNTCLQNKWGETPLHRALYRGHVAVADILIDGPNDAQNRLGRTPLHLLMSRGLLDIARKLLWSGAHPHIKDKEGRYPLQLAVLKRDFDLARLVIEMCALKGISIDWQYMKLSPNIMQQSVELFSLCEAEVQRMKEARIEGSRLSFYDVTQRHPTWAAPHLRIEAIRRILDDLSAIPYSYPRYGALLTSKFEQLEERKELYDRCLERILPSLPLPLPLLCADIILRGLRNCDMRNLVHVYELDP